MEKNVHGFRLVRERELTDTKGTLYEFIHEKTGAQLAWLKRDDENKTFAIVFKTIPEDDTGVFHMLEHSVLNGSDKYPVREPFVELLKGSMQTFLNAFTYPDKTMYPVSSRNPKDFMNLVSVYMDAVFHPAIYHNPNIFYQEGWHYEIRNKEDEPVYKGVVLNEMKGAFSSVDELLIDELNRMLFPDNCYQYVSGGDPEHITDLSYEKFLETHGRFYHPSNARVFLDGDMNIDQVLTFINDEYFSHYEKEDFDFRIPEQKPVEKAVHRIEYEIGEDESSEDKTEVSYAKIVSSFDNPMKNLAWSVLSSVLVSNNESPLKQSVLEKGLAQDVELDLYNGIQQPWVVLTLRNTNEDQIDDAFKMIQDKAEELIHNGLDHDQILASLNQMEFQYREKHEPAGLMYAQRSMDAWLYDGDPALYLSSGHLFNELREQIDKGYFESLLKEFIFADDLQEVIAVPSVTKGKERVQKETEKLHQIKESWGNDIDQYIEINNKLDEWQKTPDSEEQLHTLPKLSLSDVSEKPANEVKFEETECNGVPVILHPSEDSGIVYMNLYFSLAGITRDHLPSLGLWSGLLGNLPTENHTVDELQGIIRRDLGGLGFSVEAYSPVDRRDACIPVIVVSCSVLKQNVDKTVPIIVDILQNTIYDKARILPLLKQDFEEYRQSLIASGNSAAVRRISAHYSAEGVFREYVGGYESGLWEKDLQDHYEEKADAFINDCEMYADVLFSKDRLTVSVTGKENLDTVNTLISEMHTIPAQKALMHYPYLEDNKEFILIPGGVSYSGWGNNTEASDMKYDPSMQVLAHIMTYEYLWTEVRVKGGAYGTGMSVNPNSNYAVYSYRDPDVMHSLEAYSHAGEWFDQFTDSGMNIDQMIIGTIASGEPLLSPSTRVKVGDVWYFRGVDYERRLRTRKTLLHTDLKKLKNYIPLFKDDVVCVVGNEQAEEKCQDFKVLKKI
ncbi:MAG: insulinase family protein [Erysipelotrichaceae bacterium]|nr:insulinase family protein [Erysipelotrichaceae bacterium]